MALVACPECNQQVSDKAAACPQCGHPIATAPTRQTIHVAHKQEDAFSKAFKEQQGKMAAEGMAQLWGCLILIIAVVVIGGCLFR